MSRSRRRAALAALLLGFFAALPGCNEDVAPTEAPLSGDLQPDPPRPDYPDAHYSADYIKHALDDSAPAGASDESQAASWQKLFDGAREAPGLAGAAPVTAPEGAGRDKSIPLRKPGKDDEPLKPDHVPAPRAGTLPDVLPPAHGSVLSQFDAFQHEMARMGVFSRVFQLLTRADWHARPPKHPPTPTDDTRVTVHHTVTAQTFKLADTIRIVRAIQYYHMYGRARVGKDIWDDIGYQYLIDGEGRVVQGRHVDDLGAHTRHANAGNIGIAMIGNYDKDRLTEAQKESLRQLVTFLALKYRIDPRQPGFLEPHTHFNYTDCPGKNVTAYLNVLRGEINQKTLDAIRALKPEAVADDFQPMVVTLPAQG